MGKVYRSLILIFFIAIFLIATPIIILYTSGYRYNFEKGRVQKTGILILSTVPKKAQILLNGKLAEKKTTPAEIKHVLPGDYIISLEKEGYHTWVKKLPVYENSTTFAEKILLWKNSSPTLLSQNYGYIWSQSSDKRLAYQDDRLYVFSPANESFQNYPNTGAKEIIWSPNDRKFIIAKDDKGKKYFEIYSLNDQKTITIKDFSKLSWPKDTDEIVYGLNDSGIWKINLNSGAKELAYKGSDLKDFYIDGSKIYFITERQVFISELKTPLTKQVLCNVDNSNYNFKTESNNKLILTDNNGSMAMVEKSAGSKPIEIKANDLSWLTKDIFLYYNDFEILIYDLTKNKQTIITRVGQPITQAIWHPQGKHIIYSSGSSINIIEIDDRELRNVITLAEKSSANFLTLSDNAKILYFSGDVQGKRGIYKLELQ